MAKSKPEAKEPQVVVEDGKIFHDAMARYLMSRYTFKTLRDTNEVLVYNKKTGVYEYNGDRKDLVELQVVMKCC
jgi:hypothetical protein